jgi:hypothetical protein
MFCENIVKEGVKGATGGFVDSACKQVEQVMKDLFSPTFTGFQTFASAKVRVIMAVIM